MNTPRRFSLHLGVYMTFATAAEAMHAADSMTNTLPDGAGFSINVNSVDGPAGNTLACGQIEARTASGPVEPAQPEVERPVISPRKRVTKPAPAPETPDVDQASAIGGEAAAVAGDAPLAADAGGTETLPATGGSAATDQAAGGASSDSDGGSTATAAVPTDDELRAAVGAKMKAAPGNRAKIAELLTQLDVAAVTHVPDGARPAFLAAVNAL